MMSGARKAFSASRGSLMTAAAAASLAGLGATSVQKISAIETSASSKMATMDAKASAEITAVARKFGSGKFTDTDIAAALDKITEIASRSVGSEDSDEESNILSELMYGIHLAFYDVGATVASAGTAITGRDYEGPEEYDERYEGKRGMYRTPGLCF